MAKKRAKKRTMAKQTLELQVPDTIYDEYQKMNLATRQAALSSMLGANKHTGITQVDVVRSPQLPAPAPVQSWSKPC